MESGCPVNDEALAKRPRHAVTKAGKSFKPGKCRGTYKDPVNGAELEAV